MPRASDCFAALPFVLGLALAACQGRSAERDGPTPPGSAAAHAEAGATAHGPARDLDTALARHWAAAGVEPAARAGDHEWVRRVYLDLCGRIPTPREVESFVSDRAPDKRPRLVASLTTSEEFAIHWADVLTELLLGGATKIQPPLEQGTRAWLTRQLRGDARWSDMTRAMLTVRGELAADGPGGFITVHGRNGRVEGLTNATSRVFLGLSTLECAQCHDHPEDGPEARGWTQRDYYGMAAWWARTKARPIRGDAGPKGVRVVDKARGEMRLPTAEDPPGMRSGPRVEPRFLGEAVQGDSAGTRREQLADHILASDLWAKAIVGRAWTQLLGRGVVEPWDALREPGDTGHPALLSYLADDFAASDGDLRALVSDIVLSSAYATTSAGVEQAAARRVAFAQFPVRPMTMTQLVRSLVVATSREMPDLQRREKLVHRAATGARKAHLVEFGDDEMLQADGFTGSVPQALFLLGGKLTVRGSAARRMTRLGGILDAQGDDDARLDAVMLATLSRPASAEERRRLGTAIREAAEDGPRASEAIYEDIVHAVLMSSEFVTVH